MIDCIFCKIVAGEIPSYKIYEDEEYLAFLDISQATDGHTLLIPKKHYRWVWDMENIGEFYVVAQKIVQHMRAVTKQDFVMSLTWGRDVPHAHLHLVPPTHKNLALVGEGWGKALSARKVSPDAMEKIRARFVLS